jgi:hypothetical protein
LKEKLSVTLDPSLVKFLDRLPGASRSAKLEKVLLHFKAVKADLALRKALAAAHEGEVERSEREAWVRTMEHDQWNESPAATSGSSNS